LASGGDPHRIWKGRRWRPSKDDMPLKMPAKVPYRGINESSKGCRRAFLIRKVTQPMEETTIL